MPRLPRDVSGAECVQILQRLGFHVLRQRGSHVSLRRVHPDGHSDRTVVPLHTDLAVGTLRDILHQAAVEPQGFLASR